MASTIAAGTSAGTALAMAGDTSGSLQLQTNGTTTAVTIDTSQNVGIGTSSPGTKLQAIGIVKSGGTGTNGEFNLARTSDGLSVGKISLTESTQILDYNNLLGSGVHTFTINSAERMRIDSSGNVGIGATSPGSKLDVRAANVVTDALGQVSIYANDFGANYGGSIGLGGAYNTALTTFTDYTQIAGRKENATSGDYAGYLSFATRINAGAITERMRIDSSGNVLVTSPAGLGYGTGSGGTVTQATSKSTGVTLNKPTGQITMNNAALASNVTAEFMVTNSIITNTDNIVVSITAGSVASSAAYIVWANPTAGAFWIHVRNMTAGSLSEGMVVNFTIIKGATS